MNSMQKIGAALRSVGAGTRDTFGCTSASDVIGDDADNNFTAASARSTGAEAPAFVEVDLLRSDLNHARRFPDNSIRTAKYTLLTGVPLSLLYQFYKISNFYFLLVMIITLVPGASPINPFSSVVPLCIVLGAGIIKDLWEDWKRRKADKLANEMTVYVLRVCTAGAAGTGNAAHDGDASLTGFTKKPTANASSSTSSSGAGGADGGGADASATNVTPLHAQQSEAARVPGGHDPQSRRSRTVRILTSPTSPPQDPHPPGPNRGEDADVELTSTRDASHAKAAAGTAVPGHPVVTFQPVRSCDVYPGDIMLFRLGEEVKADCLILNTSLPDGLTYIETANLDGETNAKTRRAKIQTVEVLGTVEDLIEQALGVPANNAAAVNARMHGTAPSDDAAAARDAWAPPPAKVQLDCCDGTAAGPRGGQEGGDAAQRAATATVTTSVDGKSLDLREGVAVVLSTAGCTTPAPAVVEDDASVGAGGITSVQRSAAHLEREEAEALKADAAAASPGSHLVSPVYHERGFSDALQPSQQPSTRHCATSSIGGIPLGRSAADFGVTALSPSQPTSGVFNPELSTSRRILHERLMTLDERLAEEGQLPVPAALQRLTDRYERAVHSRSSSAGVASSHASRVRPQGNTSAAAAAGPRCVDSGSVFMADSLSNAVYPASTLQSPQSKQQSTSLTVAPSGSQSRWVYSTIERGTPPTAAARGRARSDPADMDFPAGAGAGAAASSLGTPATPAPPPQQTSGVVLVSCAPTPDLSTWFGQLRLPSGEMVPLGIDQFLPRGCMIRNTDWVLGAVVYTGCHTKMLLNLRPKPNKITNMTRRLNQLNVFLFILNQLLMFMLCGMAIWSKHHLLRPLPGSKTKFTAWYIQWSLERYTDVALFWWRYLTNFVLLSYLIPMSLYVTLEFNKAMQMLLIGADKRMAVFDEFTGAIKNARPKTSELNCQLGHVRYIFTDKTGTLTENLMTYVGGVVDGHTHSETEQPGGIGRALLRRQWNAQGRSQHGTAVSASAFASGTWAANASPLRDPVDEAARTGGRFSKSPHTTPFRGRSSAGAAAAAAPPPGTGESEEASSPLNPFLLQGNGTMRGPDGGGHDAAGESVGASKAPSGTAALPYVIPAVLGGSLVGSTAAAGHDGNAATFFTLDEPSIITPPEASLRHVGAAERRPTLPLSASPTAARSTGVEVDEDGTADGDAANHHRRDGGSPATQQLATPTAVSPTQALSLCPPVAHHSNSYNWGSNALSGAGGGGGGGAALDSNTFAPPGGGGAPDGLRGVREGALERDPVFRYLRALALCHSIVCFPVETPESVAAAGDAPPQQDDEAADQAGGRRRRKRHRHRDPAAAASDGGGGATANPAATQGAAGGEDVSPSGREVHHDHHHHHGRERPQQGRTAGSAGAHSRTLSASQRNAHGAPPSGHDALPNALSLANLTSGNFVEIPYAAPAGPGGVRDEFEPISAPPRTSSAQDRGTSLSSAPPANPTTTTTSPAISPAHVRGDRSNSGLFQLHQRHLSAGSTGGGGGGGGGVHSRLPTRDIFNLSVNSAGRLHGRTSSASWYQNRYLHHAAVHSGGGGTASNVFAGSPSASFRPPSGNLAASALRQRHRARLSGSASAFPGGGGGGGGSGLYGASANTASAVIGPVSGLEDFIDRSKIYEGQSLDEIALVNAARENGFSLFERTAKQMFVKALGRVLCYDIVAELEFTPQRKLMSILLKRRPDLDSEAAATAASAGTASHYHRAVPSAVPYADPVHPHSSAAEVSLRQEGSCGRVGEARASRRPAPLPSFPYGNSESGEEEPLQRHSTAMMAVAATKPARDDARALLAPRGVPPPPPQQPQPQPQPQSSVAGLPPASIRDTLRFPPHEEQQLMESARRLLSQASFNDVASYANYASGTFSGGGGGARATATAAPSKYLLLVKGADSSMMEVVNMQKRSNVRVKDKMLKELDAMAKLGLRTLVVGQRYLTEEEVRAWLPVFNEAQCAMQDRSEKLHEAYAMLEKDVDIVGTTAVEDKLQEEVPQTLEFCIQASIVVWMLTGDKRETAVTIAHTSGLVSEQFTDYVCHLDVSDIVEEEALLRQQQRFEEQRRQREKGGAGPDNGDGDDEDEADDASEDAHQSSSSSCSCSGFSAPPMLDSRAETNVPRVSLSPGSGPQLQQQRRGRRASNACNTSTATQTHRGASSDASSPPPRSTRTHSASQDHATATAAAAATTHHVPPQQLQQEQQVDSSFTTAAGVSGSSTAATAAQALLARKCSRIEEQLRAAESKCDAGEAAFGTPSVVIVVDGKTLDFIFGDQERARRFFLLGSRCRSAVCCRMTPLQKAKIVRMFKRNMNAVVLAIGDGANDVSMIQESSIGVGIMGLEGSQAELASDYALPKFRFLKRLLFVHGRFSVFREAHCIVYSLYKNVIVTVGMMGYQFYTGYSGMALIDSWLLAMFSIFFCSLQPLMIGILDKDVEDELAESLPKLYPPLSREYMYFSFPYIFKWLLDGLIEGLIFFFFVMYAVGVQDNLYPYMTAAIEDYGTTFFTMLVLVADLRVGATVTYYMVLFAIAVIVETLALPVIELVYSAINNLAGSNWCVRVANELYGTSGKFWLMLFFATGVMVVFTLASHMYIQLFAPWKNGGFAMRAALSSHHRIPYEKTKRDLKAEYARLLARYEELVAAQQAREGAANGNSDDTNGAAPRGATSAV